MNTSDDKRPAPQIYKNAIRAREERSPADLPSAQIPHSLLLGTRFPSLPPFEDAEKGRAPSCSHAARFLTRHLHSTAPATGQLESAFLSRDAQPVSPGIENHVRISC